MLYLFVVDVNSNQVKLLMFHNVQTNNLTFIEKNEIYNKYL